MIRSIFAWGPGHIVSFLSFIPHQWFSRDPISPIVFHLIYFGCCSHGLSLFVFHLMVFWLMFLWHTSLCVSSDSISGAVLVAYFPSGFQMMVFYSHSLFLFVFRQMVFWGLFSLCLCFSWWYFAWCSHSLTPFCVSADGILGFVLMAYLPFCFIWWYFGWCFHSLYLSLFQLIVFRV